MKFKVKGLVFVGFAAAILSANAMAAGDNTVTSKSYVDNKFQVKSSGISLGGEEGSWVALDNTINATTASSAAAPTTAAVKSYVDNQVQTAGGNYQSKSTVAQQVSDGQGGWQNLTKDTTVTEDSPNPVTSGAVYAAIAAQHTTDTGDFQPQATDNLQLGGANGTWADLGTGFASGTYTTKSVDDATGIVTIEANATTDGTLPAADATKLPTAGAVKTYVDNKATSAASNILASTQDDTDTGHALTNAATTTALAGKQALQSGDTYQVSKNGSWTAANGAVADSGTHITTTNEADGSVIINVSDTTNVGSGITSTSTSLTEGKAVYEYVNTVNNGQAFPAQPTAEGETCDANHPCALVNDNGTISWKRIAQAGDQ